MKKNFTLILLLLSTFFTSYAQNDCPGNWLSTQGNKLIDSAGNEVILSGVNWFGFETQLSSFHGIWSRDHKSVLQQIKDLGFNSIRVPWHNRMLEPEATINISSYGTDPVSGVSPMNVKESTFTKPIQLMDELVQWCQDNDIKIILDCHSRNPDAYLEEKRWYTNDFSEERWIEDWVFLANRYKNYDAVIAMDINNEPNGRIDNPDGARWGTNDPVNDWRLAAQKCGNAILKVNPNVLIMVEGIEAYTKPDGTQTSYWWGGNLQGARDFPVVLDKPSKLMYSPHEYGPTVFNQTWFDAPDFPQNMPGIWEEQFNFLNTNGTSPLFVGELGIKTQGGKDEIWFTKFIDFIAEKKLHYTFWALNPNSGDTGGILANDWTTVVQWKMDYLQPILYPAIPNCTGVLSVNELELASIIQLYPNPTNELLNIKSKQPIDQVTIYDLNGRLVLKTNFNIPANDIHKINVNKLSSGFYLTKIEIKGQSQTVTEKFIKK